ncbi:hypothetical protein ERJ75_000311600 [Trypanosoma vivax]|nr:hypothetical protein ERJ75_000311600 [Trypanosoma vivax]
MRCRDELPSTTPTLAGATAHHCVPSRAQPQRSQAGAKQQCGRGHHKAHRASAALRRRLRIRLGACRRRHCRLQLPQLRRQMSQDRICFFHELGIIVLSGLFHDGSLTPSSDCDVTPESAGAAAHGLPASLTSSDASDFSKSSSDSTISFIIVVDAAVILAARSGTLSTAAAAVA